jgi:acetyl esterase/lipase
MRERLPRNRQDNNLNNIANGTGLTMLSVEYRLAPENPFPTGNEDCYDVAEYLVDHPLSQDSGPLKFVGGESAGATLAALTVLHLLEKRPEFSLAGVCLTYGIFDLSLLPSARTWTNPLITDTDSVKHYFDAYLPNLSSDERRDPAISPIYHPIFQYRGSVLASKDPYATQKPHLPPALFLTGTHDLVLDDMVLMHFKWQLAGGEARIKFVEGAPHAFLLVPSQQFKIVEQGEGLIVKFLKEKM